MKGNTPICAVLIAILATAAGSASGAERPASQLAGRIERLVARVMPGMTHEQIGEIVNGERGVGQWADADWAVSGTGFGRFDFGDGRYLVVRYDDVGSMIRSASATASCDKAGFGPVARPPTRS